MWKNINRLFVFLYLGIGLWYLYDQISNGIYNRLLIGFAIIPVLLGPWLIKKILKYDMSQLLRTCYYLFVLLALICGSLFNWYLKISWFDLFTHFLSGIFSSVVALIFLKKAKLFQQKNIWFQILFIICFSLSIASIWEFFEFACDKFTGGDCQKVFESGVADTMEDMLVAFFGSILFSIYYYVQMKVAKKNSIQTLEKYL